MEHGAGRDRSCVLRASRLFDMHVHTVNSPDASLPELDLARRAVLEGLAGIGFVAHLDFHPGDFCTGFFNGDRYTASVSEARQAHPDLVVMCGVEIGEPHLFSPLAREALHGRNIDFITGALHWVDDQLILEPEAFSVTPALTVMERYYRTTLDMLENPGFHVLAHLGLFRRGMAMAGLDPSLDETRLMPALLQDVLGRVVEKGVILELNTSGLRRKERITYPSLPVLELYRSLGGNLVTLGSDTHGDPWVFYGLEEGRGLLLSAGFDSCCYMDAGRQRFRPLQASGPAS